MSFLVLRAYWKLIYFDFYLARGNFAALYEKVRSCPLGPASELPDLAKRTCAAVDIACIWYWKEVRCLQRSAVTTSLLRHCGVPAQMVIGALEIPFTAHAWTEVGGRAIHERRDVQKIYAVVERC